MAAAADDPSAAATDLAELLVAGGMPFRSAHAAVGDLVRQATEGTATLAELVAADDRFTPEAAALFEPGAGARRRTSPGGAGPDPVAAQMEAFAERLARDAERLGAEAP